MHIPTVFFRAFLIITLISFCVVLSAQITSATALKVQQRASQNEDALKLEAKRNKLITKLNRRATRNQKRKKNTCEVKLKLLEWEAELARTSYEIVHLQNERKDLTISKLQVDILQNQYEAQSFDCARTNILSHWSHVAARCTKNTRKAIRQRESKVVHSLLKLRLETTQRLLSSYQVLIERSQRKERAILQANIELQRFEKAMILTWIARNELERLRLEDTLGNIWSVKKEYLKIKQMAYKQRLIFLSSLWKLMTKPASKPACQQLFENYLHFLGVKMEWTFENPPTVIWIKSPFEHEMLKMIDFEEYVARRKIERHQNIGVHHFVQSKSNKGQSIYKIDQQQTEGWYFWLKALEQFYEEYQIVKPGKQRYVWNSFESFLYREFAG